MTATFNAESTMSSVTFPVVLDNIVESNETFGVSLRVPSNLSPSITSSSPSIATAIIIDSTGNVYFNM